MKRIIFTLLAIVIIATACEENEQAKTVKKEIAEAVTQTDTSVVDDSEGKEPLRGESDTCKYNIIGTWESITLGVIENPNVKQGEIVIINSQKELNEVFNKGYLPKELTNVDFTKNTVIAGCYGTTRGVSKVEHNFSKVKDKYEYTLTIFFDLTHVPEGVAFGIIVEKIPIKSEIKFKVNLINN